MTATVLKGDDKGRYQLRSLLPGASPYVTAVKNDDGTILLTPLAKAPATIHPKPRLVRRKGRMGMVVGGRPITAEDVKAALEDDL